jgi:hypothetical protein
VIAGGVTTANRPAFLRKSRRACSSDVFGRSTLSGSSAFFVGMVAFLNSHHSHEKNSTPARKLPAKRAERLHQAEVPLTHQPNALWAIDTRRVYIFHPKRCGCRCCRVSCPRQPWVKNATPQGVSRMSAYIRKAGVGRQRANAPSPIQPPACARSKTPGRRDGCHPAARWWRASRVWRAG